MSLSRKQLSAVALAGWLGLAGGASIQAQDDGDDAPVSLYGRTALSPPEGAANEDAGGHLHLRQMGERQAIHVHVRNLEPGATYGVSLTLGDETATLGSLTTRDDEPEPSRCFSARLEAPEEEEQPVEGDGDGANHRHEWNRGPRGSAELRLNRDRTQAYYYIHVRGIGEVTAASLLIGDEVIVLEELQGSLELSEDRLAALDAGDASVSVTGGGDEPVTLSGALEACYAEWRDWIARRRAGKGFLRIDTRREDEMPFGVASLAELEGASVAVTSEDDVTVLEGTIGEIMERPRRHHHGSDGDGGGGAFGSEDSDPFFALEELHDATFVRGDTNDDGTADLTDAIFLLSFLFRGGDVPYCPDAADTDDNGALEISDPVIILQELFQGQGNIAGAFQAKGFDETADEMFCNGISD